MHHLTEWIPLIADLLGLITAALNLAAATRRACKNMRAKRSPQRDTSPERRQRTE
jgi:hypothetical protein